MRKNKGKTTPHCIFCGGEIVSGQFVYMDGINGIVHAFCSRWKKDFIQDMGKYEEIVEKYPLYFSGLKV